LPPPSFSCLKVILPDSLDTKTTFDPEGRYEDVERAWMRKGTAIADVVLFAVSEMNGEGRVEGDILHFNLLLPLRTSLEIFCCEITGCYDLPQPYQLPPIYSPLE
jgi:hypothetical protein